MGDVSIGLFKSLSGIILEPTNANRRKHHLFYTRSICRGNFDFYVR